MATYFKVLSPVRYRGRLYGIGRIVDIEPRDAAVPFEKGRICMATSAEVAQAGIVTLSPHEAEAQRRSFAFGNTHIENENVTRAVVDSAAEALAANSDGLSPGAPDSSEPSGAAPRESLEAPKSAPPSDSSRPAKVATIKPPKNKKASAK